MLALITGTRPEIIKMFPVMKQLELEKIDYKYIHTGQHYDSTLSTQFFNELDIRHPDYSVKLNERNNSLLQIAEIKNKITQILNNENFTSMLVQGDTNSTLGAALAGYELNIPIYHIEAGLRSFDLSMQEERNRIVVDRISTVLFAPTNESLSNLHNEHIKGKIFVVGNTVMDAIKLVLENDKELSRQSISSSLKMEQIAETGYILITLHRAANLENERFLFNLFTSLKQSGLTFVFPMHPHTVKQVKIFGMEHLLESDNIKTIPPVGYQEFLRLLKGSKFVITDSGGLQEEITSNLINKQAVILRPNTERPESITSGHSFLVKEFNVESLICILDQIYRKLKSKDGLPVPIIDSPYGIGNSSTKIVHIIKMLSEKPMEVIDHNK